MPLAYLDKGIYVHLTDDQGRVSTKVAVDPITKKHYKYSITLKDLTKKANPFYQELYEELFRNLSSYTHLNVSSKKTYFSYPDPFFELDPCNVAGIIGLFFMNQILFEFTQIKNLSNFAYRDLNYFSDKMKEKLHSLFQFMIPLNKENEKLYSIFLECTSDWKTLK